MGVKIEILSLNVRGLRSDAKRRKLFTWIRKQSIDVIFLQETHSSKEIENTWRTEWCGEAYFAHGSSNAKGTCILFKSDLANLELHEIKRDIDGRYIIIDATINDTRLTLANVYGPNSDNADYFKKVFGIIDELPNENRLVGGDFNLVLDLEIDKEGGLSRTHLKAQEEVKLWMENTEMTDIWRKHHRKKRKYTYHTDYPTPISTRLDFFLTSSGLTPQVHRTSITHGYLTDHNSIRMILQTDKLERGPGFWKLNTSLLQDKDYVDAIKRVIVETVNLNTEVDPQLLWETIKLQCRGESIKYSSRIRKNKRNKVHKLEKRIQELEQNAIIPTNPTEIEQIKKLKQELDKEIESYTKGSFIRSRARWQEEGERSTKYFFNLEKRNFNNKSIRKLKLDNSSIISDKEQVLENINQFYSKLYTSNTDSSDKDAQTCFNINSPKLSDAEKNQCEQHITESEILAALKLTKNNKAPGSDGLPGEFYKVFWIDIKTYLTECINHAYVSGSLSITQKHGIISLLPKKERDALWLKNWRPITLLNLDYKLISKVLATRLKNILPSIIHTDQTGFIKNRYIGENINRIFSIIDYAEEQEIPAILMSVDYEKAFDMLEWSFINKTLNFFDFGEDFKRWIRILYTDITSCVVNNGWTTKPIKPSRGVRQGCPLSPYLFVLCVEVFAIGLRENKDIKGIKIGTDEHKIIQFADDTVLTLTYELKTFKNVCEFFGKFSKVSGLKTNLEKTAVMRIGSLKHSLDILLPHNNMQWTNISLKVLGVIIPNDRSTLTDQNYNTKLKNIKQIINLWKLRNLTIYGKVQLIKTYLISQVIYLLSVLPAPNLEFVKQLEQILFKFLWNDKTERIKRTTLYRTLAKGGIAMPHLPSFNYALKLAWLRRLLDERNDSLWKNIVVNKLPMGNSTWECNLSYMDIVDLHKYIKSKFWREVLEAWSIYNYSEHIINVKAQILWHNSQIKVGDRTVFYSSWYSKGIQTVGDLLNQNNQLMTFEQFITKYKINTNFVTYYGITQAIPQEWKNTLTNVHVEEDDISNVQHLMKLGKICKSTYPKFLDFAIDTECKLKSLARWEEILQCSTEDKVTSIFKNIYSSTKDRKLQSCQFHIIHRSLVTNTDLYKWKLKDTAYCTFCHNELETLQHLLLDCNLIKQFWNQVQVWVSNESGIYIDVGKEEIIFGYRDEFSDLFDLILMLGKKYIYSTRCNNQQPYFNDFLYVLKSTRDLEYECAKLYNNLNHFEQKWSPLATAFDKM